MHWELTIIKRIQSIDSIEKNTYVTDEEIMTQKEESKCINIIKHYKKWTL